MPSRLNAPTDARKKRQQDPGLDPDDITLVQHVWHFCNEHSDLEILDEILSLPTVARRDLLDLLRRLTDVVEVDETDEKVFRTWVAVGDALHQWARRWGRGRSLADAFIMRRETWRAVHTMEALSSGGAKP
jgi:hypothetical protein